MRMRLLRAGRRHDGEPRAARRATRSASSTTTLDVRDRDGVARLVRETRARPRRALRGAAVARPRGAAAVRRLRRERRRHAEPARGRARVAARSRRSSSSRRTRCTATRRTSSSSSSSRRATTTPIRRCARASTRAAGSTRRCTASSARRRPRPTCSCRSTAATSGCRRSASAAAASPGSNHASAELHGFLAYLARCVARGPDVPDLRLQGQAGSRQHPRVRRLRGGARLRRERRGRAPSTTSAAVGRTRSRSSRRSRGSRS